MEIHTSRHAQTRMQKRGISRKVVQHIIDYGTERKVPGGATARFMYRKSLKRAEAQLPRQARMDLERQKNVYVVLVDESVSTVGHRIKWFYN